jgi:hypothetical protein
MIMVYKGNYLSCQENLGKLSVLMETIEKTGDRATKLPIVDGCDFTGYDADTLMKETAKLRKLITKIYLG